MIFVEPGAGVAPIIAFIRQATQRLDINAYLVTDRTVLSAIATDARHHVLVRVLLDRHPYGGRPRGEVRALQAAGAHVHFAPARFRFDHAKYMIVDGRRVEIGSANLTYAAFTKNREYFWISRQPRAVQALRTVFAADWVGRPVGPGPRRALTLSPGATAALAAVIGQPGPVCVESEEMGADRSLVDALRRKGPRADVVLPTHLSRSDRRVAQTLRAAGVRVRFLRHPYLHAKLIVGSAVAFVGSENFSWTSLHKNREVGVLLGNPDRRALLSQCLRDWRHGVP